MATGIMLPWFLADDGSMDVSETILYIDGELETIGSYSSCQVSSSASQVVQIGFSEIQALYRYFQGQMDDVRIYNKALTEAEVQAVVTP